MAAPRSTARPATAWRISSASTCPGEPMMTAHYFDGRSARLHPADRREAGQLQWSTPSFERSYRLDAVTLAEPFAAAPAVLRFADGASCEVAGRRCAARAAGGVGYRKSRVMLWQERWPPALLALVLLMALLALVYFRGLPAAAERIAARLPPRSTSPSARPRWPAWSAPLLERLRA